MIWLFVCLGSIGGTWSFADYLPTSADATALATLRTQLDTISSGNMEAKAHMYIQLKTLAEQYPHHEKLRYYLNALSSHLLTHINTEKTKAKASSKANKEAFVTAYISGISKEITDPDTCTWWYNTLDSLSFAYNFPTAMTLAVWYRESNCGYYLPANGNGPFQIITKSYGTGTITEGIFLQTIRDYLVFSKNKYQAYSSRLWPMISYTWFTFTGLVNYAALYNGWTLTWSADSGYSVQPNNPKYVYDGYGEAYSGATRYGIIPKFIKLLQRELTTTY